MNFNKQLTDLKKSNQSRKLVLAERAGFSNVKDYMSFLLGKITEDIIGVVSPITSLVVHKCVLLDCSGSMSGSKLNNAIKAINDEIEALKLEDGKVVNYLYTLITFEEYTVNTVKLRIPIKEVEYVSFYPGGYTPLYDAIGKALLEFALEPNKVLINIFTDGEENSSCNFNKNQIKELINKYEHITVTFVGTKEDVISVQKDLNIKRSNTMSYDGTGEGLKKTMIDTVTATIEYSSRVSRGEDVKKGFYKSIVKKVN